MAKRKKPRYVKPPKGLRRLTLKEAKQVLRNPIGSKQDIRHAKSIVARHRHGRRKKTDSFIRGLLYGR